MKNAAQVPIGAPEKLLDLPEGFEIWRVPPLLLKEQNRNARVQPGKMFNSLVRNIKKRGALESLPFCGRDGDVFWIISGHHRVRAAITAGLPSVVVLVDPSARTRAEIVAKQVAHNAINGTDDPAVLLQLLDEIDDIDSLLEAAVSRDDIEKLVAAPISVADVRVDYDWKLVTFAFLPKHIKDLDRLLDALSASDLVVTTDVAAHEQVTSALKSLGKVDEIRSMGAIVYRLIEIAQRYIDEKTPPAPEADAEPVAAP